MADNPVAQKDGKKDGNFVQLTEKKDTCERNPDNQTTAKTPTNSFLDKRNLYLCSYVTMNGIDQARQTFDVVGDMHFFWKDPNPQGDTSQKNWKIEDTVTLVPHKNGHVVTIQALPINKAAIFRNCWNKTLDTEDEFHYFKEEQVVRWTIRFRATLAETLELHRFPFDRQMFTVNVHARTQQWRLVTDSDWLPAKVRYLYKNPLTVRFSPSLSGWSPYQPLCSFVVPFRASQGCSYVIRMERESSFYMMNIFLPMFIIVSLCGSSFAVDSGLADRMSVTLTLLLTTVAFKFAILGNLPTTNYTTLMDHYTFLAYSFVLFAGIENIVAELTDDLEARQQIDLWSAVIFLSLWISLHLILLLGSKCQWLRVGWDRLKDLQAVETNVQFVKREQVRVANYDN